MRNTSIYRSALGALTLAGTGLCSGQTAVPAFRFEALISTPAKIGGQDVPIRAQLGSAALNDNGQVAFLITSGLRNLTSLFTQNRLVASAEDIVDGVRLFVIQPTIAIGNDGSVAFVALYTAPEVIPGVTGRIREGLFIEHRLVLELDGDDPPIRIAFTDDGGMTAWFREGITKVGVSQLAAPLPGQSFGVPSAPQNQRSVPRRVIPYEPCRVSSFPRQPAWEVGPQTLQPIASGVSFQSPTVTSTWLDGRPHNAVFFDLSCRPTLIVVGHKNDPVAFELWTAKGFVGAVASDNTVVLNGVDRRAFASSNRLRPFFTLIRISHRQILFPVYQQDGGFSLLLGTPIGR